MNFLSPHPSDASEDDDFRAQLYVEPHQGIPRAGHSQGEARFGGNPPPQLAERAFGEYLEDKATHMGLNVVQGRIAAAWEADWDRVDRKGQADDAYEAGHADPKVQQWADEHSFAQEEYEREELRRQHIEDSTRAYNEWDLNKVPEDLGYAGQPVPANLQGTVQKARQDVVDNLNRRIPQRLMAAGVAGPEDLIHGVRYFEPRTDYGLTGYPIVYRTNHHMRDPNIWYRHHKKIEDTSRATPRMREVMRMRELTAHYPPEFDYMREYPINRAKKRGE
jgi:hypothetical protein